MAGNLGDQARDAKKAVEELNGVFGSMRETLRANARELGAFTNTAKEAAGLYGKLDGQLRQLQSQEEGITRLTDKQLESIRAKSKEQVSEIKQRATALAQERGLDKLSGEQLKKAAQRLQASGKITEAESSLLQAKAANFDIEEESLELIEQEIALREESNRVLGVTGNILKGIGATLGPFAQAFNLDKVAKDMEATADAVARGEKSGGRFRVAMAGVSSATKNLAETLTDPAVIVGSIVKTFGKFEAANKEVRQLTGQTAVNVEQMRGALESTAGSALSLVDYTKAVGSLSSEIGINVGAAFGPDTIAAAAEMTELLGLGAAETANMALRAEVFGDDLSKVGEQTEGIVKDFAEQGKGALNMQQVMANAGKASNALSMSIKGGQEGLLKAAANAQALGLNLEKAEAIADSLLNFQSSIEAEMEAELLTGKQINLEKARMAALNNDIATLTEEIASNTEIQEAFSSGNRIQQEAIAKSLGMSKDDVAKMILLSEKNKNLTEEQRAAAAGISIEEAKRLSVQDSINKSIEKMTAAFAPLLDVVAKLVSSKGGMLTLQTIIGVLVAGKAVKGALSLSKSFKDMKNDLQDMGKFLGGKGKQLLNFLKGDKKAKGPLASVMDKGAKATDKVAEATKSATAGGAKQGKGVKGFLKGLGDGLASIGKQAGNVIKGGLALGVVGVILGGSFALAMMMVKDVDPIQMIAFSGALTILGLTVAAMGKVGNSIIKGALAMAILATSLIPAAFAFSLLKGVDPVAILAFAAALPILGLSVLGLGLVLGNPVTAALFGVGILGLVALGAAIIPLAFAFKQLEGANAEGIITSLSTFAGLAPGLAAVAGSLFAVAGGLGAMAVAGLAALPVMAGLAGLGTVATGIAGVLGLGDEGGEGEAAPASNDTTILAQKLDQMNATLQAILAKEGTVTLDGTKVGTALTVANSKLQ